MTAVGLRSALAVGLAVPASGATRSVLAAGLALPASSALAVSGALASALVAGPVLTVDREALTVGSALVVGYAARREAPTLPTLPVVALGTVALRGA